jgi:hypothetical protein
MQWECGGMANHVRVIRIGHRPGRPGDETLRLSFYPGQPIDLPVLVVAWLCAKKLRCEQLVTRAEIDFQSISDKEASGTYRVEFNDGRKDSGAFRVKERQTRPFVCE